MSSPQWIDISALDLSDGVLELFKLTGARDYACSVARFIGKGWQGKACKLPVRGDVGFITVHADCYCPKDTVWALDPPSKETEIKQLLLEIRQEHERWAARIDKLVSP